MLCNIPILRERGRRKKKSQSTGNAGCKNILGVNIDPETVNIGKMLDRAEKSKVLVAKSACSYDTRKRKG